MTFCGRVVDVMLWDNRTVRSPSSRNLVIKHFVDAYNDLNLSTYRCRPVSSSLQLALQHGCHR